MLKIDTDIMLIELTRGDSASIVFSAVDDAGNTFAPSDGDTIQFAVAKKWGGTPLMLIENEYDSTEEDALEKFWTIVIDTDDWLEKDENGVVIRDANGRGTDLFKFSDYVWDCQIGTSTGAQTIIGKTNDLEPTFRALGEVAEE